MKYFIMYHRFYQKEWVSTTSSWPTGIWKRTRKVRKGERRVREGNVQGEWFNCLSLFIQAKQTWLYL